MNDLIYYRDLDEQVLVFPVLGENVGVELKFVSSISLVTELIPIPRAPEFVLGVANIDNNIYPVIDLDILLGKERPKDQQQAIISLVDTGDVRYGLHTHILPSVVPGKLDTKSKNVDKIPADWLMGKSKHEALGEIPLLDPQNFWKTLGDKVEMVTPEPEPEKANGKEKTKKKSKSSKKEKEDEEEKEE